jgi:hypothetical protein
MLQLLNDPSIPLDEAVSTYHKTPRLNAPLTAPQTTAIYSIEMSLALGAMTRAERRGATATYHPMSFNQLRALVPNFNWDSYFSASFVLLFLILILMIFIVMLNISMGNIATVNVAVPSFFGNLSTILTSVSLSSPTVQNDALTSAARLRART